MREIVFRGKRCDNGEWVYGYYVESHHSWKGHKPHKSWIVGSPITNGGWFNLLQRYAVKDDTVGQYTGLTDKNGNKIFEGDILQTRAKFKGVVTWNKKGYFYINDDEELKEKDCEILGVMLECVNRFEVIGEFEIIGNIIDTPELLKG